jgi:hypothetical protein
VGLAVQLSTLNAVKLIKGGFMKTSDKVKMYQDIEKHGKDLIILFGLPVDTDAVTLCKSLLRVENTAHAATTNLCNTNNIHGSEPYRHAYTGQYITPKETTEEEQDAFFERIMARVEKILGKNNIVFINHDPRGYALKIKPDFTPAGFYKDWGGNGIIAPDFTPEKEC